MKIKTALDAGTNVLLNHAGLRRPIFAQLEVTYRCNLRCSICNVWRSSDSTEIGLEELMSKMREVFDSGIVFLNITGGEPLLALEKISAILAEAHGRGIYTSLNTNGILLKDSIRLLADFLDVVHVSLDAPEPQLNDCLRGISGAFERAREGILEAKKHVRTAVNMTVSRENVELMEDMCKLSLEWGVEQFLTPVSVIPTEFADKSDSARLRIDNLEYARRVKSLKKKHPHLKTPTAYLDFVENGGFNNNKCRAADMMLNVKPDGLLAHPCGYFPEHAHSNVGEALRCDKRHLSGTYGFCADCTLSCFFLPSAVMNFRSIRSLLKGYG